MNHTSSLIRRFSLIARSVEQRLRFPRSGVNYALNWQLAKYYVTPLNSVFLNSVQDSGSLKNQEIEIVNEGDPYLREHAFMLIGNTISRAGEIYAERGYIGDKPVCFITNEKQAAEGMRAQLGSKQHEDPNAIGVIFCSDVQKYGQAAIVDQQKRVVAMTGLNFSELEKIVNEL